ncbi:RNA recognition domain-containing protein [Paraphaeosphaeria sporulosa]
MAADSSRLKATVFVGGLDHAVTQQTLYHAFLPFGDIVEVNLPKPDAPSSSDPHRGFGYVEFETAGDAADAIDNMDRSELFGQVIKVAAAKPQKDANEGLGGLDCKACCERGRSPSGATGARSCRRWPNGSHARTRGTRRGWSKTSLNLGLSNFDLQQSTICISGKG